MSGKSIYFVMGFHNHQPVGNFDYILDEAYDKAYWPFLECLKRHPGIKAVLHYTGPLWDCYLKEKPEWIEALRTLSKKGCMEMLSGGYYEPILVNISDRDKIAQIKKMSRLIKRELNQRASGMWCAERVWEPSLAKPISLAGIDYTVLDESHFHYAGLSHEDIFGYYVTDEQGHPLSVFPIDRNLRWAIPSDPPEKIIEYLRSHADEKGNRVAVFADDGEKFGLWPKSYKKVWQEKWLDNLFTLLEENSDWIKMTTFSEYMEKHKPAGRIYLPTASYFEMGSWALPAESSEKLNRFNEKVKELGRLDEYESFIRGGFWRNFLVKYPESNRIQKKALYVSEKVQRMVTRDKEEAENELFKAQCNCPYWHGVFGGIYAPHLRHAVQESLIRAEKLADEEFHKGEPYKEILTLDMDRDLNDEVIINTKNLQLIFSPFNGGSLYEIDYKPLCINLCDTIARREESYHKDILREERSKPEGKGDEIEKLLQYDRFPRNSFMDHFIQKDLDLNSFASGQFRELGDFANKPYEVFTSSKDDKAVMTLSRKGDIEIDGRKTKVEVEKTFFVPEEGHGFDIQYWIINNSDEDMDINFISEINLSFLSRDVETNYLMIHQKKEKDEELTMETTRMKLDLVESHEELDEITLRDGHRRYHIIINFGQKAGLWHYPVETVSKTMDGYDRTYQSTAVLPVWNIRLDPGDSWDNTISVRIEGIPKFEDENTEELDRVELEAVEI